MIQNPSIPDAIVKNDNSASKTAGTKKIPLNTNLAQVELIASCDSCGKCDPRTEGLCCQTGSGFCVSDDLPKIATFLNVDESTLKE